MSNALIQVDQELQLSKYSDQSYIADMAVKSFLPRLQLFSASSNVVKAGKFPMAHWGLVSSKDDIVDLGKQFDCIPISWRPKAMDVSSEEPLSYYNPNSDIFKNIIERSKTKNSGCMAGVEFLIWVPNNKTYATYFASNWGGKAETENIVANLGSALTFGVEYVDRKVNPFHKPNVFACMGEVTVLPDQETTKSVLSDFNDPKDSEAQMVEAGEGATRADR